MEERCAPVEFEADAPPGAASQQKLTAFTVRPSTTGGGGAGNGNGGCAAAAAAEAAAVTSGAGRHAFFRLRRMQRAAAL